MSASREKCYRKVYIYLSNWQYYVVGRHRPTDRTRHCWNWFMGVLGCAEKVVIQSLNN